MLQARRSHSSVHTAGEMASDWEARMQSAGAELVGGAGLMCHETPDAEGLEECKELGRQLANA